MNNEYYDYLINLALDTKDYEWAAKLQKNKQAKDNKNIETYFDSTGITLENINMNYGIKEDQGIRSLNLKSEYDIYNGNIVMLEKTKYTKGDIVKYRELEIHEEYFVRGWFVCHSQSEDIYNKGYGQGYQDGYNSGCTYGFNTVNNHKSILEELKNIINDNKPKKKWWKFW